MRPLNLTLRHLELFGISREEDHHGPVRRQDERHFPPHPARGARHLEGATPNAAVILCGHVMGGGGGPKAGVVGLMAEEVVKIALGDVEDGGHWQRDGQEM